MIVLTIVFWAAVVGFIVLLGVLLLMQYAISLHRKDLDKWVPSGREYRVISGHIQYTTKALRLYFRMTLITGATALIAYVIRDFLIHLQTIAAAI